MIFGCVLVLTFVVSDIDCVVFYLTYGICHVLVNRTEFIFRC